MANWCGSDFVRSKKETDQLMSVNLLYLVGFRGVNSACRFPLSYRYIICLTRQHDGQQAVF